ncbi:hypothetical protein M404DRAFT_854866 [Pisolithus tinctorius Marx 270]|uniref:Uncharacterized protein n=1 Tax=Pisolithus tinctorius Marx 270 TaxID=870435 RepID=A0A0C3JL39_PISTI|nr:hypothetical protein M404DRAFT_854866 [Pisolithus tinctorius Marx 270]
MRIVPHFNIVTYGSRRHTILFIEKCSWGTLVSSALRILVRACKKIQGQCDHSSLRFTPMLGHHHSDLIELAVPRGFPLRNLGFHASLALTTVGIPTAFSAVDAASTSNLDLD